MSKKQGARLPYSISQNFLTSSRTIQRLLNLMDLSREDLVLEIGAGKGHITRALAGRCKTVVSYEIDRELYLRLTPQLPKNVRLYGEDFLRCRLPSTPYKVFANIPFSRTTQILRKLTQSSRPPDAAWLVMEAGAAKRFCGSPRESLGSLLLKPFYNASIVYHFRREDFHPVPHTDAVLLELVHKAVPDIAPSQFKDFSYFVQYGLQNGLFGSQALLSKRQIATALRLAGLPQIERSGDILYIQWLCLFRCWLQFGSRQTKQAPRGKQH